MKLATVVVTLSLALMAGAALAGPPLEGEYKSLDGDMLVGRFSESWVGGSQGEVGNVVHVESWDGSVLGTEWSLACPRLAEPPELIASNLDANGTGMVEYRFVYEGGVFLISGTGPWGNGDAEYTVILDDYTHHTTYIYWYGTQIAYTVTADFTGNFVGYSVCLLGIANFASVGQGAQPVDYPMFLDETCADWSGQGEWGQVADVQMSIYECASGSDATTWGSIKTMYR